MYFTIYDLKDYIILKSSSGFHKQTSHPKFNLITLSLKPGLHCAIYATFTPHFMCWKYFDECLMDKNLLHISLTKFNKINLKRSLKINRT